MTTRTFTPPVQIEVFGRSDIGRKRSENQDSMLIADLDGAVSSTSIPNEKAVNAAAEKLVLGPNGLILLVADGMGGAAAGGLASSMAVAAVAKEMTARSNAEPLGGDAFAVSLRRALEAANVQIHQAALKDPSLSGMGTTATLAGLVGQTAYFAQVGDSRAYVVRNGSAVQVTRDQSVVQALVDAGKMTEDEAERSEQSNQILQALGVSPGVQVVLTYHELRANDVVLLCSDGLTRVVSRDEIAEMATRITNLATLAEALIDLGNERGGPDNITVVAARMISGLPAASESDVVTRIDYGSRA